VEKKEPSGLPETLI